MTPALYLIATPIGNLEDITLRALRILREEASVIACEDTRETRKLLQHYDIRKSLISYHEYNESTRTPELLLRLEAGQSVALLSDAGTPLVSDPGYRVVKSAIENGFAVIPIPGASAVLAALAASGLPTDTFRFLGFLPSKAGARRKALQELTSETASVIAYESPHRIMETLADIAGMFPDRSVVVAREITKIHEEFLRGSAKSVAEKVHRRGSIKGEITLLIGPSENTTALVADPLGEIAKLEEEGMDRMQAIKIVAKRLGVPKRDVYRLSSARDSNRARKNRH